MKIGLLPIMNSKRRNPNHETRFPVPASRRRRERGTGGNAMTREDKLAEGYRILLRLLAKCSFILDPHDLAEIDLLKRWYDENVKEKK